MAQLKRLGKVFKKTQLLILASLLKLSDKMPQTETHPACVLQRPGTRRTKLREWQKEISVGQDEFREAAQKEKGQKVTQEEAEKEISQEEKEEETPGAAQHGGSSGFFPGVRVFGGRAPQEEEEAPQEGQEGLGAASRLVLGSGQRLQQSQQLPLQPLWGQ